ncbi:MAG: hypothetical protein ABJA37_15345 [Ferruginibacter sp.]
MNDTSKKEEYKKTQATSSPGALGEDANRNNRQQENPISKDNIKTSKEEGLNQEHSDGNAGAFEGLENAGDSGE